VAIEHQIRNGALVWIKNPVTGVVSYVVDVRAKSFAFAVGARESFDPTAPELGEEAVKGAIEACPFCPGNEALTTRELLRLSAADVPEWAGGRESRGAPWVIRAFNNLFPRVPAELTGNRNESYIVVEDPRHFIAGARSNDDLIFTAALGEGHFLRLVEADVRVMKHALGNPAVKAVVVRKNQGRESGASQPHIHQQIIGGPEAFPAVAAEARAQGDNPRMFEELIELFERVGLVIQRTKQVVSYVSPIGTFPRSYDVVMPEHRGLLCELSREEMHAFGRAMFRLLKVLGPLPLDYEIHQGEGLPLHAHINGRLYPYANVAGTLNLPDTLLASAAAIRRAIGREK
jgi:UDPglucose--hexose-1-phosphate uridylyltransferase